MPSETDQLKGDIVGLAGGASGTSERVADEAGRRGADEIATAKEDLRISPLPLAR